MKKKQFTILALVLVVIVVVAALILNSNRLYKPTSFVVDGDNWSATVVDGSSIRLELNNNSKEWSIISEPETFVSDFHTITENISEFHIIALNDGEGEMVFQCTKDDGSIAQYILELCSFNALCSPSAELPINKKRTRTLFHKESGSSTNCMVDGTGLEPVTSCTSSRCSTS